ncbi:MAG: D-alanyl-D-alanine carboxypeptidase [Clostridiales bacterium]|nr:D-alanyl-D-alanine carboxypeptidase [Clostridiales bacterium]
MKRTITFLIICVLFLGNFNIINAQTTNNTDINQTYEGNYYSVWSKDFPTISADAAIVMEAETGSILYGKNIHNKYYPASITKILTTLIALENSSMNEIVTFSRDAVFNVDLDSSRIGIDVGEELSMEQALYGIMLESANEVSYAVAEHVGGDINTFIDMMNQKARSLGANNSNFMNPHGLPDENHYTTPYDMALISKAAIQNNEFREITNSRTYVIPPTNIQEETRYLANHHKFIKKDIHYDGAIGGKTGWTRASMYTLVTFAKRDGMTLISVIMSCPNAKDQYKDTANLLNYAFDNFSLYSIDNTNTNINKDIDFFTKYRSFFNISDSPLRLSENGNVVLPSNITIDDVKKTIELDPLETLVEGENIIGSIVYSFDNNKLGKTDIIYDNTKSYILLNNLYLDPIEHITESPSEINDEQEVSHEESNNPYMPIVIGVGVGLLVVIVGLLIIYRRNIKARRRRRRTRSFKYSDLN